MIGCVQTATKFDRLQQADIQTPQVSRPLFRPRIPASCCPTVGKLPAGLSVDGKNETDGDHLSGNVGAETHDVGATDRSERPRLRYQEHQACTAFLAQHTCSDIRRRQQAHSLGGTWSGILWSKREGSMPTTHHNRGPAQLRCFTYYSGSIPAVVAGSAAELRCAGKFIPAPRRTVRHIHIRAHTANDAISPIIRSCPSDNASTWSSCRPDGKLCSSSISAAFHGALSIPIRPMFA
jgi:hypothetical protein